MYINGKLMLKDTIVANIIDNYIEIVEKDLCPLYFTKNKDIESWLRMRAIDSHRTHSRLIKKALRIKRTDDIGAVLKFNAATITDCYWIKLDNEDLSWNDIRFKDNKYSELALKGDFKAIFQEESRTPELTNIGSFEKCWKQDGEGNWWLYKDGTNKELYSELFVNKLGLKLGFDMANYELEDNYVKSKDFTNNGELTLELMRVLMEDEDDFEDNFKKLYSISEEIAKDYIKMIYLDTLSYNVDRHTENYGLLRDSNTGEILKLAPNFDNNLSLISRNQETYSEGFISYFTNFMKENDKANKMFHELEIPKLNQEDISKIVNSIDIKLEEKDYKAIENIVLGSQEILFDRLELETNKSLLDMEKKLKKNKEYER